MNPPPHPFTRPSRRNHLYKASSPPPKSIPLEYRCIPLPPQLAIYRTYPAHKLPLIYTYIYTSDPASMGKPPPLASPNRRSSAAAIDELKRHDRRKLSVGERSNSSSQHSQLAAQDRSQHLRFHRCRVLRAQIILLSESVLFRNRRRKEISETERRVSSFTRSRWFYRVSEITLHGFCLQVLSVLSWRRVISEKENL